MSLTDTVDITDKPSRFKSPKDSLPLAATGAPNGKTATDTMPLQDSTAGNGKAAADTAGISDKTVPARTATDFMPLQDSAVRNGKAAADAAAISDTAAPDRTARDLVPLGETASVQANAFHHVTSTDTVVISDRAPALDRTARDTVALSDKALKDADSRDVVALSDSPAVQTSIYRELAVTDVVAISDARSTFRSPVDAVPVTDATSLPTRQATSVVDVTDAAGKSVSLNKQISDAIGFADAISLAPSLNIAETISVTEAPAARPSAIYLFDLISMPDEPKTSVLRDRAVADGIAVADGPLAPTRGAVVHEPIGVADKITRVSVHWSRSFDESLTMQECTPFACNQVLHFGDAIALGDRFALPPAAADTLAVGDSISRSVVLGRSVNDSVGIAARDDWTWTGLPTPPPPGSLVPPLNMMMTSSAAVVNPMQGAPVTGTFTLLTPDQLVDQLNPPILPINDWASYPDLPRVAMVLPTYQVDLAPTPQMPGDDAMLTARMAQVPADMRVSMPIDLAGTPQTSEHGNVPWMRVEYVPKVDSANFAMMMAIIDSPHAGAGLPPAEIRAIYIDFDWVGSFLGPGPDAAGHYRTPPTFTFAVTDAWAVEQNVQRDSNNIPVMSLSLLDDATGTWSSVAAAYDPAASAPGQYAYVAQLEHFSTYAITANKSSKSSGAPGPMAAPQTPPVAFVVQLYDSAAVGDSPESKPIEFIEEFSKGKSVTVRLADLLRVATKPVAYNEISLAGKDATARATLDSVETEEGAFGRAVATVLFHLENKGDKPELFVLDYSYVDESGKKAYGSSKAIELAPGELKVEKALIPFTKPGSYRLLTEVRSDAGALLGVGQVQVEVSWLAVNLYPLIAAGVVILAATAAAMALYIKRRPRLPDG